MAMTLSTLVPINPPASSGGGGTNDHTQLTNRAVAGQHPATAVSFTPTGTVSSTTVQAAIAEVASEAGTGSGAVSSVDGRTGAVTLTDLYVGISTYDANSLLTSNADNSPAALTVPVSTIVGRGPTGNIAALTTAATKAMLGITTADVSGLGALATKTTIVDADVASGAAIALSKLAVDPRARSTHTGTQLSSTISDLAAARVPFTPVGTIAATDVQAAIAEVAAEAGGGGIPPSTLLANQVLKADVDSTPIGLTVAPSTFVGRAAAGGISALTSAQAKTILAITSSDVSGLGSLATKSTIASADITDGTIVAADLAVDPYARANHTGTQAVSTITGLNAAAVPFTPGGTVQATDVQAAIAEVAAEATAGAGVPASTWTANSVVKADTNATPIALSVPASSILGRDTTGGITALTTAATKTLLGITTSDVSGLGTLATKSTIVSADITDGTITSADIADATIVNADIALGAAIDLAKLAVDPLNRANHTGTQLASTISNFDAQVRTSRLDQMAKPTAVVDMNGQRLTGLASPTVAGDSVNKAYADNVSAGLSVKTSVKVTSTANVTISAPGTAIDGVTLANGQRVLLKDQTDATQNGIYVFNGSAAAMTRAPDADVDPELSSGAFTFTESGTANGGKAWVLNTPNPITIGTTAQTWVQFAGGGSNVVGTANRILVTGPQVDIDPNYVGQASITTLGTITTGAWNGTPVAVANGGTGATTAAGARTNLGIGAGKYTTTIGNGSLTSFTVTHNLNTKDVVVELYELATGLTVYADITRTTVNAITVGGFTVAPTTAAIAVVVMG